MVIRHTVCKLGPPSTITRLAVAESLFTPANWASPPYLAPVVIVAPSFARTTVAAIHCHGGQLCSPLSNSDSEGESLLGAFAQ